MGNILFVLNIRTAKLGAWGILAALSRREADFG